MPFLVPFFPQLTTQSFSAPRALMKSLKGCNLAFFCENRKGLDLFLKAKKGRVLADFEEYTLYLHFQRLAHTLITVSLAYSKRWGECVCSKRLPEIPLVPVNHRQQQSCYFFFVPLGLRDVCGLSCFHDKHLISNIVLCPVLSIWTGCTWWVLWTSREHLKYTFPQKTPSMWQCFWGGFPGKPAPPCPP